MLGQGSCLFKLTVILVVASASEGLPIENPSTLTPRDTVDAGSSILISCSADVAELRTTLLSVSYLQIWRTLHGTEGRSKVVSYSAQSNVTQLSRDGWNFSCTGAPANWTRGSDSRAMRIEWGIEDLECSDTGLYECCVGYCDYRRLPRLCGQQRLTVTAAIGNLSVHVTPSKESYTEGENVSLTCEIDGPRDLHVMWNSVLAGAGNIQAYNDTDNTVAMDRVSLNDSCGSARHTLTLSMQLLPEHDGGTFLCLAQYGNGTVQTDNISFTVATTGTRSEEDEATAEDDTTTLGIESATNCPGSRPNKNKLTTRSDVTNTTEYVAMEETDIKTTIKTNDNEVTTSKAEIITKIDDVTTNKTKAEIITAKDDVTTNKNRYLTNEDGSTTKANKVTPMADKTEDIIKRKSEITISPDGELPKEDALSTNRNEVTTNQNEVTTNQNEDKTNQNEVTTNQNEVRTNKNEVTTIKGEDLTAEVETSISTNKVSTSKHVSSTLEEEVRTTRNGVSTRKDEHESKMENRNTTRGGKREAYKDGPGKANTTVKEDTNTTEPPGGENNKEEEDSGDRTIGGSRDPADESGDIYLMAVPILSGTALTFILLMILRNYCRRSHKARRNDSSTMDSSRATNFEFLDLVNSLRALEQTENRGDNGLQATRMEDQL